MSTLEVSNKRILKNTLFLYVRMFFVLLITLFTSRIVLQNLGFEDYGLYNVVGGLVVFVSFIRNTLTTSTSRYITYEIGNNIDNVKNIFAHAFAIHFILAILILIIGEILGIIAIHFFMNIPEDRLFACNIVFQLSLISTSITILLTPFNSVIVANEKFNMYAYIGIVEVILKLIIAYIISISPVDKMVTYSILMFFVTIGVPFFNVLYVNNKFKSNIYITSILDIKIIKSMISFTLWGLIGSLANTLKNNGINILINIFFGATVNAANAIAYQVNAAVNSFTANFTTASNPQITKAYASGAYLDMQRLIFVSGKISFFLLITLCYPIIFKTEFILTLWLQEFPPYTVLFTKLVLILSLVETFTFSIGCGVQATGNIKYYQIVISGITILNFPIAYISYKLGLPPSSALIISIVISSITLLLRLYFMKLLLNISPREYVFNVLLKCILVTITTYPILYLLSSLFNDSIIGIILLSTTVLIYNCVVIFIFGLDNKERNYILLYLKNKINAKSTFRK